MVSVSTSGFADALKNELTIYGNSVQEQVNVIAKKAANELVKKTRSTAPVGKRSMYRKNIAVTEIDAGYGMKKYIWHVKGSDYRLTHLLVHGHATRDGERTTGNPFLHQAIDEVTPVFERGVKEAIQNGG